MQQMLTLCFMLILSPAIINYSIVVIKKLEIIQSELLNQSHFLSVMDRIQAYVDDSIYLERINEQSLSIQLPHQSIQLNVVDKKIKLKVGKVTRYLSFDGFECNEIRVSEFDSYIELIWNCSDVLNAKQFFKKHND